MLGMHMKSDSQVRILQKSLSYVREPRCEWVLKNRSAYRKGKRLGQSRHRSKVVLLDF